MPTRRGSFGATVAASRPPARAVASGRHRRAAPAARATTTPSWSSAARCTPTRTASAPGCASEHAVARARPRPPGRRSSASASARSCSRARRAAPSCRRAEPEVGWHEVELAPAAAGDPAARRPCPERFLAFQWHYYTFDAAGGRRAARAQPGLHAGLPARRARLGRAVPPRGDRGDRAALDRRGARGDGTDPEALRRKTRDRIAGWNELGRALCAAFLAAAADAGRA